MDDGNDGASDGASPASAPLTWEQSFEQSSAIPQCESDDESVEHYPDEEEDDERLPNATSTDPYLRHWQPDDTGDIGFTHGRARQFVWDSAKYEIGLLKKNIRELAGADEGASVPFCDICSLLFNRDEGIVRAIAIRLRMDDRRFGGSVDGAIDKVLKWLATFIQSSIHNTSITALWDAPDIQMDGLQTTDEYVGMWRRMARCGIGQSRSGYLWTRMETIYNEHCRDIIQQSEDDGDDVPSQAVKMCGTFDDDKNHVALGEARDDAEKAGLKLVRHTDANRKGSNCHTLALVNTGVAIGIYWERETGSATQCYRQVLSGQFGEAGELTTTSLSRLLLMSDRGYLDPQLYPTILRHGGDVLVTFKRGPLNPFYWGKKLPENDGRILVQEEGAFLLIQRRLPREKSGLAKDLVVQLFRQGNGNIVVTCSSLFVDYSYDAVPLKPRANDIDRSSERITLYKSFPPVDGSETQYSDLYGELRVLPLLCQQGKALWFIIRRFAITSSTCKSIVVHLRKNRESLPPDIRAALVIIDNYLAKDRGAYDLDDPPQPMDADGPPQPRDESGEGTANGSLSGDGTINHDQSGEGTSGSNPSGEGASGGDQSGKGTGARDAEDDQDEMGDSIRLYQDGTLTRTDLNEYVNSLGDSDLKRFCIRIKMAESKIPKTSSCMRKNIAKWADADASEREFMFLTVAEMRDKLKAMGARSIPTAKPELLDLLAGRRAITYQDGDGPEEDCLTAEARIIRSSFMKPLKGKAAKECSEGHKAEPKLVKQFLADANNNRTIISVHEVNCAGIVQSLEVKAMRDSTDRYGIASHPPSISRQVFALEMKARVKPGTEAAERARIDRMHPGEVYKVLDAHDPRIREYIPCDTELQQLLHHVSTAGLKLAAFLVGGLKARIMCCYWIKFDARPNPSRALSSSDDSSDDEDNEADAPNDEDSDQMSIVAAWTKICQYAQDEMMPWIYDTTGNAPFPEEAIAAACKRYPYAGDVDTVKHHLKLWKKLNLGQLPLQDAGRLLPIQIAIWNSDRN